MTLRHLKIFSVVCRNGCSITRAANQLHITQPAVSQAIRELEEYYNTPLFDREMRKLVITKAGEKLKEYTDSIGAIYDDMDRVMKNWDKEGVVRVGATLTIGAYFMPGYIRLFKEVYPNANIQVFCGPANILEQKILDNELDVAFSEGIATDPLICSTNYMDDHLVAFCSADGPFERGQEITAEQFSKQNFILREKGSGTRKVFELACEKLGFVPTPMWESVSNTGIINAVANGLGVGVLSYRLIRDAVENGRIVPFVVQGLNLNRKFYIINHKNKTMTSMLKYFLYLCNDTDFEIPEI